MKLTQGFPVHMLAVQKSPCFRSARVIGIKRGAITSEYENYSVKRKLS